MSAAHPTAEELARFSARLLGADQHRAIATHLEGCERCRGELDTLRAMNLGATTPDTQPPLDDSISFGATRQRLAPSTSEESLPAVAEVVAGQQVGRYVITAQLGRGAMGLVLAAKDPRLERKVAIKLLRPDVPVVESAPLRARLVREAQALAQLSHPNVVSVHDVGDYGDSIFIAMDYVEGQTLTQWMRSADHPWRAVVDVFLQAGRGLAAAHRAGLVHRDFKPDNVLVGNDGHVRVSDFGVSRRVRTASASDEETITGAGSLIGTPMYMSPEQFDGKAADARSDQFSFCVALYEALYGRQPFRGETLRERRDAVHAGPPVPQPAGKRVPAWLHALVLKGLATKADDRFPSMEALLAVLGKPPRNTRLWAAVTVAVLAVMSLSAWLVARELERRRNDPCQHIDDRVRAVWSPEARAATKAAVEGTKKSYAPSVWRYVETTLDQIAERWARDYRTVCEQTGSSDSRIAAESKMNQLCLERRLRAMANFLNVLEHPSDSRMIALLPIGTAIAALEGCGESATEWTEPENPAQRAVFREIRDSLERASMEVELARDLRGLELATAAVERARKHNFRYLEAHGLYAAGVAARHLARYEDAVKLLEQAALAGEAGRADAVVFDARCIAAEILIENISLERGKAALPAVKTAMERVGETKGRRLMLFGVEAALASQEGRHAEAVAIQRKLLDETKEHYEHGSLLLADEYRILARYLGRANQVPEALEALDQSMKIVSTLMGENHPHVAIGYTTRAMLLGKLNENEQALEASQRALSLLDEHDDPAQYQQAMFNIGLLQKRLKRLPEAEAALEKAIAMTPLESNSANAQMLGGYAEVLQELGKLDKALQMATRAVEIREKVVGPDSIHMTSELATQGSILESLGRHEEAARILERTLAILEKDGSRPVLTEVTRYELARSLYHSPETRNRSVEMVRAVSVWFHAKGPTYKDYFDEADDWLKKHPPLKGPVRGPERR